jgi:hypothetical protein
MNKYRKGIFALIAAVVSIAAVQWGTESWFQQVIAVLSALGVYAIPNEG